MVEFVIELNNQTKNNMSEYELNVDESKPEPEFSEVEKSILSKLEDLSKECSSNGVSCFLTVKCASQENASAIWHFGDTPNDAYLTFAKNFAPVLLHITSNLTGTKVTATNPNTNAIVFEVVPQSNNTVD